MAFLKKLDYMFQPTTKIYTATYAVNLDKYDVSLFGILRVSLPQQIEHSMPKRQSTFLSGRYAASHVLSLIGCEHKEIPIGKGGSPSWPSKVVGSISHTESIAVCACASKTDYMMLGIDVEHWMSASIAEEVAAIVLSENDRKLISTLCSPEHELATLIFSAKESLFKALYPRVGYYFEFSAVSAHKICLREGKLTLKLNRDLADGILAGDIFSCTFSTFNDHIFTIVTG
jgi:enterobactin synthetase component D